MGKHKNRENLVGKTFGRWTVVEGEEKTKWGTRKIKCRCECGKEKFLRVDLLKNGESRSCGCLKQKLWLERITLPKGISERNKRIDTYKRQAKIKNLPYELDLEQFLELTQKNCFYCGAEPTSYAKNKKSNGSFIGNGIDRIDNTKGYTIKNTLPCCQICNLAKRAMTFDEFKIWNKKVFEHLYSDEEDAKEQLRQFFIILDSVEETDSGNEFHPVYISSCRIFSTQKLEGILTYLRHWSKIEK